MTSNLYLPEKNYSACQTWQLSPLRQIWMWK